MLQVEPVHEDASLGEASLRDVLDIPDCFAGQPAAAGSQQQRAGCAAGPAGSAGDRSAAQAASTAAAEPAGVAGAAARAAGGGPAAESVCRKGCGRSAIHGTAMICTHAGPSVDLQQVI